MSYEPIRAAFETFFLENFVDNMARPFCPVKYANTDFAQPDGSPYVDLTLLPVKRDNATVGTDYKRTWMLAQFQILIPAKTSTQQAYLIADKIAYVLDDRRISYGSNGTIFCEPFSLVSAREVNGWWQLLGRCQLRSDERTA